MSKDLIYGPLPKHEKTVSDLQLVQAALEAALNVIRARDRRIAELEAQVAQLEAKSDDFDAEMTIVANAVDAAFGDGRLDPKDTANAQLADIAESKKWMTEQVDEMRERIAELEATISALPHQEHCEVSNAKEFPLSWATLYPGRTPKCQCNLSALNTEGFSALDAALAQARQEALADYLHEAREFSERTFGAGRRTLGVTKHIEKEIAEVRAKPDDLTEWVDIIILACDGYWRHGGQPGNLLADMLAKLAKNKARVWPKPTSEDEPVEHDRTHDPLNPELGPEHREFWVRRMAREVKP